MAEVVNLMEKSEEKKKALEAALSQIEKNYGKGSVMKLGDPENVVEIEAISTGSLGLDVALGIGGLPKGRIIEIYGPESSGKTTLALHTVAEAQKTGGICGFIDAEHALDPAYANKLGVNIEELLISQPDNGEQALEIADTLVRSGAVDGRQPAGLASPFDEPSAQKIDWFNLALQYNGDFHQPNSYENRCHVRLAGNHDGRQCAEVLFFLPFGHSPYRRD